MRKGLTGEILAFVIIAISVLVLGIFFAAESTLKSGEVRKTVTERKIDESVNNALIALYNNKLEKVQKTYMEILIDAALQSYNNYSNVYYGPAIGLIKADEIIYQVFDKWLGKNHWKLILNTTAGKASYGDLVLGDVYYKYTIKIPNPPKFKGEAYLYVG